MDGERLLKYLWIYLIVVNLIGFIVWCLDKYYARKDKWRVPEKVLFGWALIGGSLGCLCAMRLVRHKTRHWYFAIGIPLILALQAIGLVLLIKYV